jgi:hypothetical protein
VREGKGREGKGREGKGREEKTAPYFNITPGGRIEEWRYDATHS